MILLLFFVAVFIGLILLHWCSPRKSDVVLYGYQDLKNSRDFPVTPGGIPKIIFKTSHYKKKDIPREMMDALRKTQELNPGYLIYYFDDDDMFNLVSDFSDEMPGVYKSILPGAYRADIFRVCALYKYGGCYSDIGHVPLFSFDDLCEDANIILVNDMGGTDSIDNYVGIHNALMCSVPNHVFFKLIIDKITGNIRKGFYGENTLDITGPTAIGKVFNCYFHGVCDNINKKLLKTGVTSYDCDNCKVKIFQLSFGYIVDNDKNIIKTKFDNYHNIIYKSRNTLRYNELWKMKKVYQDE